MSLISDHASRSDEAPEGTPAPAPPGQEEAPGQVAPPADPTSRGHREQAVEESFDRIVTDGRERVRRPWIDLLATGAVGGTEVGFGVLALLFVEMKTGSELLGGLAFSIGFIGLLLGHSELFTEGFLVPVTTVAAGEARVRDLLRMWTGTLVGNLAGGWVMAIIIDQAYPALHPRAVETAATYINTGFDGRTLCLALLGGGAITLMTRMHNGTDSMTAKLVASVAIAFLLAGTHLFHSILNSLLAFTALGTGHAPFGYLDWLAWFAWVVTWNVVGGLGLTTILRLIRSRRRLGDYRSANERSVAKGRARHQRQAPAA